jgi:hypothetical protein
MADGLPTTYPLNIYQGDFIKKSFRLRDSTIDPITGKTIPGDYKDLTGKTVQAEIRSAKGSPNPAATFICAVDPDQLNNTGVFAAMLLPEASKALSEGNYVWDCQVKSDASHIKTYLAGPVTVVGEITEDDSGTVYVQSTAPVVAVSHRWSGTPYASSSEKWVNGVLTVTNGMWHPSTNDATLYRWTSYSSISSTYVTVSSEIVDGHNAIRVEKNVASTNLGAVTYGLDVRPEGTTVTVSAEVRFPPDTLLNGQISFIWRDAPNNDSSVYTTIVAGAVTTTVPKDGQWHRVYLTSIVKTARNLTTVYICNSLGGNPGQYFNFRNVMVADGALIGFFDGDSGSTSDNDAWVDDDYVIHVWDAQANAWVAS